MRFFSLIFLGLELAAVVIGILSDFVEKWSIWKLPEGQGATLAMVGGTMALVLIYLDRERAAREVERQRDDVRDSLARRLTVALATHERDFHALFPAQVLSAQNNVDITHLGPRSPEDRGGPEEKKYFQGFKRMVKDSHAEIRRVERLTRDKLPWIEKLVNELGDLPRFSLRVYYDPSRSEMPFALSVSRIDDRFAWIVAMAEHASTGNCRDLMLTGEDTVRLVAAYFQNRLWLQSVPVVERGEVMSGWREQALQLLGDEGAE